MSTVQTINEGDTVKLSDGRLGVVEVSFRGVSNVYIGDEDIVVRVANETLEVTLKNYA